MLNTALDPLFIFVFRMGTRRQPAATIISQGGVCGMGSAISDGKQTVLRLKRAFRGDRPLLASAVGLGASPFVMQSTESLLTIAFNVSLQRYGGDAAVGAMTILTSVAQMVQLPLTGLAQGAQPIFSYACGAKPDRMKRVVQLNLAAAFVIAFSIWAAVQLFPHTVVHLFTSDEELVERTVWALRVYFALGFTNAFETGFQQSFVALGEARISLFLALERKVFLLIPFILILPHFFADKLFAVFLAEPVADFLAGGSNDDNAVFDSIQADHARYVNQFPCIGNARGTRRQPAPTPYREAARSPAERGTNAACSPLTGRGIEPQRRVALSAGAPSCRAPAGNERVNTYGFYPLNSRSFIS